MKNVIKELDQIIDGEERMYRDLDRDLTAFIKRFEASGQGIATCTKCTNANPGCCYQKVIVPFVEALPIARRLRRAKKDSTEFRAHLRTIGEAMESNSRADWFYTQPHRPCVFLENGRCSIYEVRPMVCRTFVTVTPQENCQQENRGLEVASMDLMDLNSSMLIRARQIHTQVFGLRENNQRMLVGSLPRMVALALEVWENDNYADVIRREIWPTINDLSAWADGSIFKERHARLVQIRNAKATIP